MASLCQSCGQLRRVVSGTGAEFLLCKLSQQDPAFQKYPPQPVWQCSGYAIEQSSGRTFTLDVLPSLFAVCRLDPTAVIPQWAIGEMVSITRTASELSITCVQDHVPASVKSETNWRCLRIAGVLDFSLVGVVASLTTILAAADISVFVCSTFDTDYLLFKEVCLDKAVAALTAAGHVVR